MKTTVIEAQKHSHPQPGYVCPCCGDPLNSYGQDRMACYSCMLTFTKPKDAKNSLFSRAFKAANESARVVMAWFR